MGGGLGRVTKHSEYYLIDGSVSFLTCNTLFRVHRSFFERESEVFRDLFAHAAEEDVPSGTDARPYTLDVKPQEFERFLWVWYDREYTYRQQSKEHWTTILQLASRWEFPKIRELAIRELDALGLAPAERVAIYNQYGVDDDHLLDSYIELCKSPTIPTEEEGHLMEMETLINVLQAREDTRRRAYKLRQESPTSAGLEDETLREIVSKFFKTGLNPRSNGASMGAGVQASTLNGDHVPGAGASATIILGEPQVPDKRTQASRPSSHTVDAGTSLQTGSEVKGKEEKEKARLAKEKEERERAEKAKLEKEAREKKKEEDQRRLETLSRKTSGK